jgi:hypothetical protein
VSTEYKCTTGDGSAVEVRKIIDAVEVIAASGSSIASACLTPTDARAFASDVLAAAGGAAMTGREAADAFLAAEIARDESGGLGLWKTFTREWFAAHWPADRHAPAATAGGVVITGRELFEMMWPDGSFSWELSASKENWDRLAEALRARAVPAGAPGWVERPTGEASSLVVPEDGCWIMRHAAKYGPVYADAMLYKAGHEVSETYGAIRRIDTDAPTTWIRRQPATPGGWTAASVEACVGQRILCEYEGSNSPSVLTCTTLKIEAGEMAADLNRRKVTAYMILPPTPERGA